MGPTYNHWLEATVNVRTAQLDSDITMRNMGRKKFYFLTSCGWA
jgi:hypothetical protein